MSVCAWPLNSVRNGHRLLLSWILNHAMVSPHRLLHPGIGIISFWSQFLYPKISCQAVETAVARQFSPAVRQPLVAEWFRSSLPSPAPGEEETLDRWTISPFDPILIFILIRDLLYWINCQGWSAASPATPARDDPRLDGPRCRAPWRGGGRPLSHPARDSPAQQLLHQRKSGAGGGESSL